MNGQSSYLVGAMNPPHDQPQTMIKQEHVYHTYEDQQQQHQPPNILRDAFMMTMSDDGMGAVHNHAPPTSFQMPPPSVERVKQRHIYESPEARARRLARNAERMRERRANETEEEYRVRREKMAAANRHRRMIENDLDKALRHLKDAARQRLRRAMESPEQRAARLEKLAERSRISRMNESPEQKAERNRKCLESNKIRYQKRQAGLIPKAKSRKEKKRANAANAVISSTSHPPQHLQETGDKKMSVIFTKFEPVNDTPPLATALPQNSYEQIYSTYPSFRSSPFPDLPPHIAPNQPKYYGHIQNFVPPQPSQLQYIQPFHQSQDSGAVNQIAPQTHIIQTSAQQLNAAIPYNTQLVYTTAVAQPILDVQPGVARGRPIKILPSNNYQTVAPAHQHEAVRQQKLNNLLEEQISIIMTSPKQSRGRPSVIGEETDQLREERLRKMREARKAQRDLETPEQRESRLKDLSERARKRRVALLTGESEEDRRERLRRQAEYARERRNRGQTPQAFRQAQQDAKNLYAKLHH